MRLSRAAEAVIEQLRATQNGDQADRAQERDRSRAGGPAHFSTERHDRTLDEGYAEFGPDEGRRFQPKSSL
jgi:hypothetical protein